MPYQSKNNIEKLISTHTKNSADDSAAVTTLKYFFRSNGRINTNFSENDKWPNHDGTFEFVTNPDVTRSPTQNFFVQIKGSCNYTETDNGIKYSLKSLAFPAFISQDVTLDPGILFLVLNPSKRNSERVFWKYMSVEFLNSLDFNKESATINFSNHDEIFNTDEGVISFCKKLEYIVNHHSFVNMLSDQKISKDQIDRIIQVCDEQITESIDMIGINFTRDKISQRILPRLNDLCKSALWLNSLKLGNTKTSLQLAWEQALLNIDTKYLATFLKGLNYIDNRIPDDGQTERLMLKYYNFLWQIREFLNKEYGIKILHNLEKFPLEIDEHDSQYYELVAVAIASKIFPHQKLSDSRFYIVKKTPFFVGKERYYEVTLQLAGIYATKFNRLTAYTKENITTNYSVKIGYVEEPIVLWGIPCKIKIITNWSVSIDPRCLNRLGKILNMPIRISAIYDEYNALMQFLTITGINFLELIDLEEISFSKIVNSIYEKKRTNYFKNILIKLNKYYNKSSKERGCNTIRYILINLREETLIKVMPSSVLQKTISKDLNISTKCCPFEKNPFISNLPGSITNDVNIKYIVDVAGNEIINIVKPYLKIKNQINRTGEIYFDLNSIASEKEIVKYNNWLNSWKHDQGYDLNLENGMVSIDSYETTTIIILKKLLELSMQKNKGQKEFNQSFLKKCNIHFTDALKEQALKNVFVNSHILLIYGAAGTGKTTLINYISSLMSNQRKLFLTKTHASKQNLKRRIDNPGTSSEFVSIDSFTKRVDLKVYDVIFVDECSIIDNRTMYTFLKKIKPGTFLVFAGDIHQIESINFGNWFLYAKDIIKTDGSNVELLNTWRTEDENMISLWDEVRNRGDLITEKLVIDGPFSENIGKNIFEDIGDDEVILCLNYDGKFGLNNMNNYFQNNNQNGKAVSWQEWTYKIGDSILFNDSERFQSLYNNLKGKIVDVNKTISEISFTIDVKTNLTEKDCIEDKIEFIDAYEGTTRISFSVFSFDNIVDMDDEKRKLTVVPFQLAYAVSIHKAQGLEYDTVKVIIPKNNAEKITHGIFYTAITRAKKKLKIYWSSEIMNEVINSFGEAEELTQRSLEIVHSKLSPRN